MKIRNPRRAMSLPVGLVLLLLAGCRPAQQSRSEGERSNSDLVVLADDTRKVAEQALGEKAEVLASGDLARNELEQLLVVNRFAGASRNAAGLEKPASIFITRAAILQKSDGQWTEVLLCDEHLKNPNGYLGGSPVAPVTGWRLEFKVNTKQGLEMKFTPATSRAGEEESGTGELEGRSVFVQWNTTAKRYQSLDTSHERYLSEAPTLETPHSILR